MLARGILGRHTFFIQSTQATINSLWSCPEMQMPKDHRKGLLLAVVARITEATLAGEVAGAEGLPRLRPR